MTLAKGPISVKRTGFLQHGVTGCFVCATCGALSLGTAYGNLKKQDAHAWLSQQKIRDWHPRKIRPKLFHDVPAAIASIASEAYRAKDLNMARASVLLARATIEASAKDKGINNGALQTKISQMHEKDLIGTATRDAANHIRLLGNEAAHGDLIASVTIDEAKAVLDFMSQVLIEIYQMPAKLNRAKAAQEARKNPPDVTAQLGLPQGYSSLSPQMESVLKQIAELGQQQGTSIKKPSQ